MSSGSRWRAWEASWASTARSWASLSTSTTPVETVTRGRNRPLHTQQQVRGSSTITSLRIPSSPESSHTVFPGITREPNPSMTRRVFTSCRITNTAPTPRQARATPARRIAGSQVCRVVPQPGRSHTAPGSQPVGRAGAHQHGSAARTAQIAPPMARASVRAARPSIAQKLRRGVVVAIVITIFQHLFQQSSSPWVS